MSMKLCFDIETIPSQKPGIFEMFRSRIEVGIPEKEAIIRSKYKKPETIDQHLNDLYSSVDQKADDQWRKTSLNGLFGEIISIAWKVDHGETKNIIRTLDDLESNLIHEFFIQTEPQLVGDTTYIGHNLRKFDMLFIWQRCKLLNIDIPTDFLHALQTRMENWKRVFDIMLYWSGAYSKLDTWQSVENLCTAFDIPSPKTPEIDGSKIWDHVKAGKYADVAAYNCRDVDAEDAIAIKLGVDDIFDFNKIIQEGGC